MEIVRESALADMSPRPREAFPSVPRRASKFSREGVHLSGVSQAKALTTTSEQGATADRSRSDRLGACEVPRVIGNAGAPVSVRSVRVSPGNLCRRAGAQRSVVRKQ